MKAILNYFDENPTWLYVTFVILLLPALFIHLGLMPLLADEPTRAVVALEMILSENYWISTIAGEYYYNKPPLYNWLLATLFNVTGNFSEFLIRLPAVIPLLLFAWSLFLVIKKQLSTRVALFTAIFFLTNARLLLYDSMLGHIDILFSWLTWLGFMAIYHYGAKEKWLKLFVLTYLITAIGFLSKGLPSLAFQAISLLTYFIYRGKFWRLFAIQHFIGILIFVIIILIYFIKYLEFNTLDNYLETLWDQSSQRTAAETGWKRTILHILLFPFEHIAHLFPWSLLVVFCFIKGFWKKVFANEFLAFCFWIFVTNILIYWLSPETRPRYLFMLYPIFFMFIAYGYEEFKSSQEKLSKIFDWFLIGISCLITLSVFGLPFYDFKNAIIPYFYLKIFGLGVALFLATFLVYQLKNQKIIAFGIILLLLRIGFNWFVLPDRYYNSSEKIRKEEAIDAGNILKDKTAYQLGWTPINHNSLYYLQLERMQMIKRVWSVEDTSAIYISTNFYLDEINHQPIIFKFKTDYEQTELNLVKFNQLANEKIIRGDNRSE